jgi:hypothetical protein
MHRYWLKFVEPAPKVVALGCGVTAYDYDDALDLVRRAIFGGGDMPEVADVVVDVDVSMLDKGHVLPSMEPPNWRGVWFPMGFGLRNVRAPVPRMEDVLDGIPGAFERAQLGLEQARLGQTIPLDALGSDG